MNCEIEDREGTRCGRATYLIVSGFPMCHVCMADHDREQVIESIEVRCASCGEPAQPDCWLLPERDEAWPACRDCVRSPDIMAVIVRMQNTPPMRRVRSQAWNCSAGEAFEARCAS